MVQNPAPRNAGYRRRGTGHLIIVQKKSSPRGALFLWAGGLAGQLSAIRYPLPASRRLVFTTDCLICFEYRDSSLCGDPAEGLRVSRSWSCVEQQCSNIVILILVHPFATSWHFAPVGSVSLDSQSPLAPYESSSLATSRGNEKFRIAFLLVGRPAILRFTQNDEPGGRMAALQPSPSTAHAVPLPHRWGRQVT